MTLSVQLMTMAVMVGGGVYLGFTFDTYSRVTRVLRRNTLLKYVLEMFFWLAQTGALFYLLFLVNEGELRIYVFLACLLGYSVYVVIFRKSYLRVLDKLIYAVLTVFRWIFNAINVLLIQPVIWTLRMLYTLAKWLVIFVMRCMLYPINWLFKLFRWLLPETFLKRASHLYDTCSTIVSNYIQSAKELLKNWR